MRSFQFGRKVEICGDVFYIGRDMEKIAEAMRECSQRMLAVADKKGKDGEDAMEAAARESKKAVDAALGDGAFDRIFKGTEPDMINLTSLIDFIAEEIRDWKAELMAKAEAGRVMLGKLKEK